MAPPLSDGVPPVLEAMMAAARAAQPRIVLSEGEDPRIQDAARRATADGLARLVLLGDPKAIQVPGVEVLLPETAPEFETYVEALVALRQAKGMTPDIARRVIADPLGFAAMMVRQDDAHGTIGGAVYTTGDTVRAALQIVGRAPGAQVVSGFFLMLLGAPYDRPVVFADCALTIEPTAAQLADIAIASAGSFEALTGDTARVALLSFSTKGSASHASVDRIQEALDLARARAPDLAIDGDLQFDAAFVPDVAARKASNSPVAGQANVFVFPDLNSGNIGYKIAQRIGGAMALGPVLQGLAKPANDLSRGCSAEDVYQMIAITGAQAAARRPV